MGNLNCSNCRGNEDLFNEIRTNYTSIDNISYPPNNIESPLLKSKTNTSKGLKNPLSDYSLALFERFNMIRTDPLKFYSESDKYNLSNIIEELIDKDNKPLKLIWSSKKEEIINNIMRDKKLPDIRKKLNMIKKHFSKEFDLKVYYTKGNFARIDDALWNVLFGLKNISEEKLRIFLTKKYDYCVIYSINEDEMKSNSKSIKEEKIREKKNNQRNSNGAIISFFILFNHSL